MGQSMQRGFADRFTLIVVAAAFAAGLGLFAAQRMFTPRQTQADFSSLSLKSVHLISPARELAPYRLTQSNGQAVTPESLRGHWTIVFLGFTHCPDVCPTTLAELAKSQKHWQAMPAPIRPRVLFVSVDPERDSPQKTGEYARFFHPDTIAATAQPAALAGFARSLGLVYMKVALPDNKDYTVDHSATLVVLDPQGRQAGLIRPPLAWSDIAEDMSLLTEQAP